MTWKSTISLVIWICAIGAALFVPAGTLDWRGGWIFMAEILLSSAASIAWLAKYDPGLLKERVGSPVQKGQPLWDKVLVLVMLLAWYGWMVLMALDVKRWHVSDAPPWLTYLGALLIPLGVIVVLRTFRENSFAAPVVRIQDERGQRVIDTGPYAIVRHPMYAGGFLYLLGTPLVLGSWLGLAALPAIMGLLIVRIFIEEAALRTGLPGYSEYATRVRYRLIPGVW